MRIKIILLSLMLLSPALSSCVYKMDIRQGNYVTQEMREKLKIGMTKVQVRYVLGTPLVNDPFHANRWDYVYRLEHDRKLIEQHNLTLYFEGDKLARIIDGNLPAGTVPAKVDGQAKG
jgi:outer membrane protein assembly factor BamE